MSVPRLDPSATLLGDGRVLVVGSEMPPGEDYVTPTIGTAELWDPATGGWRTTEPLNKARSEFVAVPLADGRALVAGGTNLAGQSFSSAYVYDPGDGTWSKTGLMTAARSAPAAAVLPDGRVLVAGGYFHRKPDWGLDASPTTIVVAYRAGEPGTGARPVPADVDAPNIGSALATAELFDAGTGEWTETGPLKYARYGAAAVTLADGRVLIVGSGPGGNDGVTVDARAFDTAELYDPETGKTHLAGRLPNLDRAAVADLGVDLPDGAPGPAANGTLVALDDGGALLVGHASWWKHEGDITMSFRFDPTTETWREVGEPYAIVYDDLTGQTFETRGARWLDAQVAPLGDGRVLIAGGRGSFQAGYDQAGSGSGAAAELYDAATDTWSPLPPMPDARMDGAAVTLADGSVLLIGGARQSSDGSIYFDSAVRFVPAS